MGSSSFSNFLYEVHRFAQSLEIFSSGSKKRTRLAEVDRRCDDGKNLVMQAELFANSRERFGKRILMICKYSRKI